MLGSNIKKVVNHAEYFQQLIGVGQFVNSDNSFICCCLFYEHLQIINALQRMWARTFYIYSPITTNTFLYFKMFFSVSKHFLKLHTVKLDHWGRVY